MIDLEESIHCDFFPTGQDIRKRIVNASKQYDLTKYQLTTSIRPTITIQAPEVIGNFPKGLHILDLERKALHITGNAYTARRFSKTKLSILQPVGPHRVKLQTSISLPLPR